MANKKISLADYTLVENREDLEALNLSLDEAEQLTEHMNKIRIEVERVWKERYKLPKSRISKYIAELPEPKQTTHTVKGLKLPSIEVIQYFTPDEIELLDRYWRNSLSKMETILDNLRREDYEKKFKEAQEDKQGLITSGGVM